jgi:hypothetical protein
MPHRIIHWLIAHKVQITNNLQDYAISLSLSIGGVFTLQNALNWFVHTIGACASTLIVSLFLYFVMRKVKQKYP